MNYLLNVHLRIGIPDDTEIEFTKTLENYVENHLKLIKNIADQLRFQSGTVFEYESESDELNSINHEVLIFHISGDFDKQSVFCHVLKMIEGLSGLLDNQDLIKYCRLVQL